MTNREIMVKAIDKCCLNGIYTERQGEMIKRANPHLYVNGYIFSHNFAKAFWGEEVIDDFGHLIINNDDEESEMFPFTNQEKSAYYREQDVAIMQKSWQYHLQQMVLEEEPLKYLEKFL